MTPGTYDVVVVGGGFFGCCLALYLKRFHRRVLLLERETHLLGRASLVNQARVHNGYHYPRSVLTALRSRVNFDRFVSEYEDCVVSDFTKLYAVPRRFSNVTAAQFRGFCERIGAPMKEAPAKLGALFSDEHIEAVYEVREYAFDAVKLRERVVRELEAAGVEVRLGTEARRLTPVGDAGIEVLLGGPQVPEERVRGTYVFNSTYARLNTVLEASGLPTIPLKYEVAEMALIDPPEELRRVGVTVMCGPFFSTMPYPSRGLHTLSHVRYTPHGHWHEQPGRKSVDEQTLLRERASRFPQMVKDSARFLPCLDRARYVDSIWETKTILPVSEVDDSRPILMKRHHGLHNLYCVMGGKLDNIFDVMHELDEFRRQGELS